ncbi:hypothetical protein ACFU8I_01405 [Streptomyces sp. NPDC057540]|uniref:hypothetical protein n=1 Tax=Streptomyces sp. NPDC057540 TaxID=3346160 RepID=UPI003695B1C2
MSRRDIPKDHSARLAVDDLALQFAGLAEREWPQTGTTWRQRSIQDALAAHSRAAQELDPKAAGEYFTALRRTTEAAICDMVQSYPSVQWLWYLRRLPDLFDGALPTTGPYDRQLMDLMAAASTKTCAQLPIVEGQISFPVTEGVVRRVLRLCAMAVTLSDIHSRLRRAGKGIAFMPQPEGLPVDVPNEPVRAAIDLYDQRVCAHPTGLTSPGTLMLPSDHRDEDPLPIFLVSARPVWDMLPTWQGALDRGTPMTTLGRFAPHISSLREVRTVLAQTPMRTSPWWEPELPALIALLQALSNYLAHDTAGGWLSLVRYGYITLRWKILSDLLNRTLPLLRTELDTWFPPSTLVDAQQVLERLDSLPLSLWPQEPGPIFHRAGPDVLVDFDAASRHLLRLCTVAPANDTPVSKIRADHFEDTVQQLIDRSPWKPSQAAPARSFKPRPVGREVLTDFDAVGEEGDTLLIVSCKSRPYTARYDAGDHKTVRNAATLVEGAVTKWAEVVAALTEQPVGANYDFSRYRRILGVVCIPHTPYTVLGPATEVVDTNAAGQILRAANSYEELAAWLSVTER